MKCRECSNPASGRASLYCGDKCIRLHVKRAKNRLRGSGGSLVVKNYFNEDTLKEPNGPGLDQLEKWLLCRPTFYVDVPEVHVRKRLPRECKTKGPDMRHCVTKSKSSIPSKPKSPVRKSRKLYTDDSSRDSSSKISSARPVPLIIPKLIRPCAQTQKTTNEPASKQSKSDRGGKVTTVCEKSRKAKLDKPEDKIVRKKAITREDRLVISQNLQNTLNETISKHGDVNISEESLKVLCRRIEEELYKNYEKNNEKYKNKYRTIIMNLKNDKSRLYYKIIRGIILPSTLVKMSSLDMAPEQLLTSREEERQTELEKLEKHSKDFEPRDTVIKTHKGEKTIPRRDLQLAPIIPTLEVPKLVVVSTTLSHGEHVFCVNCAVCMGEMPLSDLILKKIELSRAENTPGTSTDTIVPETRVTQVETVGPSVDESLKNIWENNRSARTNWKCEIRIVDIGELKVVAELVSDLSFFPKQSLEVMKVWKTDMISSLPAIITTHLSKKLDVVVVRFWPTDHASAVKTGKLLQSLKEDGRFGEVEKMRGELFKSIILLPADELTKYANNYFDEDVLRKISDESHLLIGLLFASARFKSLCEPECITID